MELLIKRATVAASAAAQGSILGMTYLAMGMMTSGMASDHSVRWIGVGSITRHLSGAGPTGGGGEAGWPKRQVGYSTGTVGGANDDSLSASPHDAGPRHTAKRLEDLPTVLERIIKAQQTWEQCSVKQAGDHHTLPDVTKCGTGCVRFRLKKMQIGCLLIRLRMISYCD